MWAAVDAGLGALWALGAAADLRTLKLIAGTLTVFAVVRTLGVLVRATRAGVGVIRKRTAEWRPGQGDLAKARRHRPHRVEADPDVAHDEYAVAVADDGRLVTFCFTPLMAGERPVRGAILITGTPRYEAVEVRTEHFDAEDSVRAAEQLAEAQEHAARLEAAAVERARTEIEELEALHEHAIEARTTADALRRITGQ